MEKPVVLYVDDEPINIMLFEALFTYRFQVLTANSGAKGLEVLSSTHKVRVVISDMRMPEMSGIEFIEKAMELHPNVFYYILTGYEINDVIQNALTNGLIAGYFQKPFHAQEIENSILDKIS